MTLNLPDFRELSDDDLRRVIADLQFNADVATDFLNRAKEEQSHRKAVKKGADPKAPEIKEAKGKTKH